jgi:hypothetical protein
MKNALVLVGLWIGIILTAYTLVYWNNEALSPAQLALFERLADRTYLDATGRFEVELLPGWRAESVDYGVRLIDPVERIEAWVLAVDETAGTEAIDLAWEIADPCFDMESVAFEELPTEGPGEASVKITYVAEDQNLDAYGVAHVALSGSIVTLVRGDRDVWERRADELKAIEASLTVPASR